MIDFLAVGDWQDSHVHVTWMRSGRALVPEVEELVEREWAKAMGRPGVKLFDGPMCRLESWSATADRLKLRLSPTSYKPFLGTNLTNPDLADRFGRQVMANPVGVSPAIVTSDGFLMLGQRNATVAYYPGRVHPFAGALEPRDGTDVFQAVRRELSEELALRPQDLEELRLTGLAEDRALRQPELLFAARTPLTRRQIETQVDAVEHRHAVAVPIDPDAVARATHDADLTPVAVACLLLFGRLEFGEPWFRSEVNRVAPGTP